MMRYKSFFLLLFFLSAAVNAQVVCDYCKGQIEGEYIRVEGYNFHPKHFVCAMCGNPIDNGYVKEKGKFYHPECGSKEAGIICAQCGKPITGHYMLFQEKKYHEECFTANVAIRCAVCNGIINGTYGIDVYGNKYHAAHEEEYSKCDNCSRLICTQLTGGGYNYSDGRHVCRRCADIAIYDQPSVQQLLIKVMGYVRSLGMSIDEHTITVRPVDKNELKNAAASAYSPNLKGFCKTRTQEKSINGKVQSRQFSHTIYVLNGVPALNIESTIAHELTHVWINVNTAGNQSSKLAEGSCNYIAYMYLLARPSEQQKIRIALMENDPDPTYGEGFRYVREKFGNKSVQSLLNYLSSHND